MTKLRGINSTTTERGGVPGPVEAWLLAGLLVIETVSGSAGTWSLLPHFVALTAIISHEYIPVARHRMVAWVLPTALNAFLLIDIWPVTVVGYPLYLLVQYYASRGDRQTAVLSALGWLIVAVAHYPAPTRTWADITLTVTIELAFCTGALAIGAYRHRLRRERSASRHFKQQLVADLHDNIAHSLTRMSVLAETARTSPDSERRDKTLQSIAVTARTAIAGLHELISTMDDEHDDRSRGPRINLATDLPQSIEMLNNLGLTVEHVDHGELSTMDTETSHSTAVIVREMLLNVAKHAKPGTTVFIESTGPTSRTDLQISVLNRVASSPRPGTRRGIGLNSMKTRSVALGGRITFTSTPDSWLAVLTVPISPNQQVSAYVPEKSHD